MRSSFFSAAVLAFASAVYAQTAGFDVMSVPTKTLQTVTAGDSYTIKWDTNSTFADGTVSLKLLEGADAGSLDLAADFIVTGVLNSLQEYTWHIPQDIKIFGLYGIQISWDNDPKIFQWSNPFKIVAGSSSSSSSASGGSSTASVSPTSTKTVVVSSNTAYSASTTSSAKITSSASTNTTIVSTASSSKFTAASNATLSTSASLTASKTSTSSSSSSTSSGAAAKSSSAAVANFAKGSFAVIGGAVLAFVL